MENLEKEVYGTGKIPHLSGGHTNREYTVLIFFTQEQPRKFS